VQTFLIVFAYGYENDKKGVRVGTLLGMEFLIGIPGASAIFSILQNFMLSFLSLPPVILKFFKFLQTFMLSKSQLTLIKISITLTQC
jgi:hypothetical protein